MPSCLPSTYSYWPPLLSRASHKCIPSSPAINRQSLVNWRHLFLPWQRLGSQWAFRLNHHDQRHGYLLVLARHELGSSWNPSWILAARLFWRRTRDPATKYSNFSLLKNFSMSNVLMFWLPSSHPCQLPAALEQVPQSYKCWKITKQWVWQVSPKSNFFGDSVSVWVYRHSKIVKMLGSSPVGPPEINWRTWLPQGTRF